VEAKPSYPRRRSEAVQSQEIERGISHQGKCRHAKIDSSECLVAMKRKCASALRGLTSIASQSVVAVAIAGVVGCERYT